MTRSPAFSMRSLTAPVRFRRVASGLMIEKVRSRAMAVSIQIRLRGTFSVWRRFTGTEWKGQAPRGSDGMQMETAMSIEVMAFLTVVAVLFVAGFASGPVITRIFHLDRHDHPHGRNGHAH